MKSLSIHRSYFYYAEKKDDNEVIDSIRKASEFGRKFRVLKEAYQQLQHQKELIMFLLQLKITMKFSNLDY